MNKKAFIDILIALHYITTAITTTPITTTPIDYVFDYVTRVSSIFLLETFSTSR